MTTAEKSRQSTAMISTQRLFTRLTEYGIVILCNNSDDDDDDSNCNNHNNYTRYDMREGAWRK